MTSSLRILIADDEEVVRLFIARILEELGYACDFALDGQDCLDQFASGKTYDVLFLDLVMPRMDGEGVLREIISQHPNTSVIMASVQDDEEAIKELLAEGATAYLTKPIKAGDIEDVMAKLEQMRAT